MKKIIEFANANDYEKVEYLGKFKGEDIYDLIYRDDGEIYFIGLPRFLVDNNGALRISGDDESFEIMDHFFKDED